MQFYLGNSYNPACLEVLCCDCKVLIIFLFGFGSMFPAHLFASVYRTLSCLAHWSAIFAETPYMPLLAFPFVKLFQNNQLICFEVVATVVGKQRF